MCPYIACLAYNRLCHLILIRHLLQLFIFVMAILMTVIIAITMQMMMGFPSSHAKLSELRMT